MVDNKFRVEQLNNPQQPQQKPKSNVKETYEFLGINCY